jgi:hypothetical protein
MQNIQYNIVILAKKNANFEVLFHKIKVLQAISDLW